MPSSPGYAADRGAADPISLGAALLAGKKPQPDATRLLMQDHLEAMGLFDWYERAESVDERTRVADRLCLALSIHMQVEEEILYPAAREATGDDGLVDRAVAEHAQAKEIIAQLKARPLADESQPPLVRLLRAAIVQHVTEEETEFFPRLRETDLDLYELGREVAARRVELFFDLTGRSPVKEDGMETASDMNAGRPLNVGRETGAEPISADEARRLFVVGLRNAHAAATNCLTMVERQLDRLESYPKVAARLTQHREEKQAQIQRLEQVLSDLGESPSGLKDAAMGLAANVSSMMNAAAGDEILKNSMANAAMAQFEIAAYKSLLIMGAAAGEVRAIRTLQKSLSEERAMAAWLEDNLPGTVLMHMQLKSQGEQAKR